MELTASKIYYDALQKARATGQPVAKYVKTIVGKVCVKVIDQFTGSPTELILAGEPGKVPIEDIVLTFWTDFEHEFFRRANKPLLDRGDIAPFTEEIEEKISVNEISDAELEEALKKKFFAVKALLDKFTSPVPVERMLRLAKEMNVSVGVVGRIEERLSELQANT